MIDQPGEAGAEGNALREIGREAVMSECSDLSQEMGGFQVKKYRQEDGGQARNRVVTEIFEKVPDGESITRCSPPKSLFTDVKNEE